MTQSVPGRATSFRITSCGLCPNPHVVLFDDQGRAYADFILGPGQEEFLLQEAKKTRAEIRQTQILKQNRDEQPR